MSRYVAAIVGAVALFSVGCPEKPKQGPGAAGDAGGGKAAAPAAPEDTKYSKADPIDGVTIETEMSGETPDIPGGGKRTPAEEAAIKAMAEKAKFRMTLKITDERTRMTVVGENMPMPEGSFILYDGPGKRYAFVASG